MGGSCNENLGNTREGNLGLSLGKLAFLALSWGPKPPWCVLNGGGSQQFLGVLLSANTFSPNLRNHDVKFGCTSKEIYNWEICI